MQTTMANNHRDPLLLKAQLVDRIDSYLEDQNLQDDSRELYVFSASELGSSGGYSLCRKYPMGCGRMLYYRYSGEAPERRTPPRIKRIFDIGSYLHDMLQTYLENICRSSPFLFFEREVVVSPEDSKLAAEYEIYSTMDGLFTISAPGSENIVFVVEIKTISADMFKTLTSALDYNIVQLNVYMALTGIHRGVIIYINKNDGNLLDFPLAFEPKIWKAVTEKINYVRDCRDKGTIPDREVHFFCGDCKYNHICKPKTFSKARPAVPTFLRGNNGKSRS